MKYFFPVVTPGTTRVGSAARPQSEWNRLPPFAESRPARRGQARRTDPCSPFPDRLHQAGLSLAGLNATHSFDSWQRHANRLRESLEQINDTKTAMKNCLIALLILSSLTSHAQFLGGYADGLTSVPTGRNTFGPALRMVYDDFTFDLPGNIIQFQMIGRDNTGSPVAMYYEIRSGVSAGNGGTLVASGLTPTASSGPLPLDGSFGIPPAGSGSYGYYDAGPSIPIHVDPGTYWIGLAPLQGFGSWDVTSTQGLGAIGHPINNGNAFYYNSADPLANFASMGAHDFGLRIYTDVPTTFIPEPNSLSLIALGILGFFRRPKQ